MATRERMFDLIVFMNAFDRAAKVVRSHPEGRGRVFLVAGDRTWLVGWMTASGPLTAANDAKWSIVR